MIWLLLVSLLWGLSFGLVKAEFAGLGPATLAAARLALALPCFVPFLRPEFRRVGPVTMRLAAIGAVQYGLMYVALFRSFAWLNGHEVALLTVFTPVYVIAAHALLARRHPPGWFWLAAALAVAGALWTLQPDTLPRKWPGILFTQVANVCFAGGQIAWRELRVSGLVRRDRDGYALLYMGGVLAALPFALAERPLQGLAALGAGQWAALVYLGVVASGLGFYLWNAGAARVNPATLAVFNNLKIPIAIALAIGVFGERSDPGSLIPGLVVLLGALALAEVRWRRAMHR